MGPYEEGYLQQPGDDSHSIRQAVLRRPGMFLGDLEDGQAYGIVVAAFVDTLLNWRIGANLRVELMPGNRVRISCRREPAEAVTEIPSHRPLQFVCRDFAVPGLLPLWYTIVACGHLCWEIRDRFGAGTAVFADGVCRSASAEAPELPPDLCTRIDMTIGSDALPTAPASLAQVAAAARRVSGPADPAYWGCVTIGDRRSGETATVLATTPPRRFAPP
ncbi:MAG: hypothetical protein JNK22_05185 [Rhodocyclaceae bacterium]|nr:hypothetical protein [Rhodocyclaceae bacterium]